MKKNLILAASTLMAAAALSIGVYASDLSIVIDGETVASDTEPQITAEGRTIVPLRVISEQLGAEVDWDGETKTVTVKKDAETLKLTIGDKYMKADENEIELDSPAQIVNERTMVPLRAISESFGCKVDWDAETKTVVINTETPVKTEEKEETYKSNDGWSVKYNSDLINVNEDEEGVSFVYTGESAGTNMLKISYIKDKMPQEVLGEVTADWDAEKTIRKEGYFAGDNWAFLADIEPEGGSGLYQGFTAAEYNDGTLLVERIAHVGENTEDEDTLVSDTIANVIDSIEFENYRPQTQFEYVPGIYTKVSVEQTGDGQIDIINLNKDHTALLSSQDEVKGIWTSIEIRTDDNTVYEYTVEGDKLYLKTGEDWVEFAKTAAQE